MLFNSIEFFFFCPVVFLLYWWVFGRTARSQNLWIVAASFYFYASWDWRFLFLFLLVIVCGYAGGLLLQRHDSRGFRRLVLWGNVAIGLGILGTFKYFDFFAEEFRDLLGAFGIFTDDVTLGLVLPVGISFYTLQSLGYVIDVYRGTVEAERRFLPFCAFISFFPQLVAGPIERASNLLPQFNRHRSFVYADAVEGCRRILWGLVKKVVIADHCAMTVNYIFGNWQQMDSTMLWVGAVLFTFQIYGDFSGYSDIAIGTARLFGIRLSNNFATPFLSKSIPEFWSRWHISLSSWLRDYLYIPLGGGRKGKGKKARNIFVVFLVSGLWHGANWTYVLWGGLHALYQLPTVLRGAKPDRSIAGAGRRLPKLRELGAIMLTFLLAVLAFVPFRSATIRESLLYLKQMLFGFNFGPVTSGRWTLLLCVLLMVVEWCTRHREFPLQFGGEGLWRHRAARYALYYLLIIAVLFFPGSPVQFIYFQF